MKRFLVRGAVSVFASLAFAVAAQTVTVVEYYNKTLDAYFISGRTSEQTALDGAADFRRTGMTFQAVAAASAPTSLTQVCRFYISIASPYVSSHFYGRQGVDCESLQAQKLPGFTYEGFDFAVAQPNTNGTCAAGTTAIYRGFRAAAGGKTSNHRYSASLANYTAAVAAGYVGESAAFCATSATEATSTVVTPPSATGDCGTFYYPGKRVTYQSSTSGAGVPSTSSFVRSYDPSPVSFHGQTATQIVDTGGGTVSSTMILDQSTSWSALGGRSGAQETYFAPPIVYPKVMAVGQSINLNYAVQYSPASATGNQTQTGSIVLTGRETVTVPAGTYANACKFTINTVTQTPAVGSSSTTRTIAWVADGVGLVRSEITDTTSAFGFNVVSSATLVATAVQ